MYHSFLIHSFIDGHLRCYQHLAIVNSPAKNIGVHRFFWNGILRCYQHLAIVNSPAKNIGVHRFFWNGISGFLGYTPSSRLLGQKAIPFSVFWDNSILFSTVAAIVCIPTNSALGFPFLHILSNTCCLLICLWWPFSPVWYVVSHCGFNLHLTDGYWCWTSFHMFLGPLYVVLGNVSV